MMNLEFDPEFRSIWMFPRNIRKIYPWKIAQICQLIEQIANNNEEWTQDIQNQLSQKLADGELKSQNDIRDIRSGGTRTYISQLESLGILFKSDKKLYFTLAGKSLLEFENALKVVQTQLLNYQYPSPYSINRNVKINPQIKIKPFVFLLELLVDPNLKYLTVEEMVLVLTYGKSRASFSEVKGRIIYYRKCNGNRSSLLNHIDFPAQDLYTPRTKNNTPVQLLKEALDVANTMKNYLTSASLAYENEATKQIYYSSEDELTIFDAIKNSNSFIGVTPNEHESFQRKYGAWNRKKDTSSLKVRKKRNLGETSIVTEFLAYIGDRIVIDSAEDFITGMVKKGYQRGLIESTIAPLIPKALTFFESKYIELSRGGAATATAFEKATAELFIHFFGFTARHTGSSYKQGVGGNSDILLLNGKILESGLIDTKAVSAYTLSSADYAKMKTYYIPDYTKFPESATYNLSFVLYIAAGFAGGIHGKLYSLFLDTSVPASAISAKTLIEVAQSKSIPQAQIWETFKKNKLLAVNDFLSSMTKG